MVEQIPLPLDFGELIKEARKLPTYTGNNREYSLTTWLEEATSLLQLVQPGDQQSYVLRLILYKLQGEARHVVQKLPNPTWNTVKNILLSTFGVHETYSTIVNRIHKVSSRNIEDTYYKLNKLLNRINTKYVQDPQRESHSEFNPIRNENLVLNKFKSLLPEFKSYLIETRNCETLNQAYNLLREIEQNIDNSNYNNKYKNNSNNHNNNFRNNSNPNSNTNKYQTNRYNNHRPNNNNSNRQYNNSNHYRDRNNNNNNNYNQNSNRNYNRNYNSNNRMETDNSNIYRQNNPNPDPIEPMDTNFQVIASEITYQ